MNQSKKPRQAILLNGNPGCSSTMMLKCCPTRCWICFSQSGSVGEEISSEPSHFREIFTRKPSLKVLGDTTLPAPVQVPVIPSHIVFALFESS